VVVARRDIGRERSQRIKGSFLAVLELQLHVLLDELHRHVAGALDHDLHVVVPRDIGQFAQCFQLGELSFVVGVIDRTWTQAITERE
jgi:hypothetical protein